MYYFAYASNLNRKQMAERCPDSKPKFPATLPNHKLIFAGWLRKWHGATASIKPFQGKKVVGGVYEVSESDMACLDKHESCPAVYSRVNKVVFTEDGEAVEVVTYIMRQQSEEAQPSREYVATIQQGYRDWGIV
jgi:gamma-glutamylcyclotransferase